MSEASFEISGSSTGTPNAKIASKFNLVQAAVSTCIVCSKRVYDMEKISIDQQQVFHKSCFRCSQCRGILTVRNYTMVDGELFCKQHYVRQFKEVGGKYNFTGQSTTPNRTIDVASLSVHSSLSSSSSSAHDSDAPRPVRSWQPTRNDSDKERTDNRPPPMVDLCSSPTSSSPRILSSAAGVASIRSMFETQRDKKDQTISSPTEHRPGHGHAYVEGEEAVISMMKTQSSVKARRAQFAGNGGSRDDHDHEKENVSVSSQHHQPHRQAEYCDVVVETSQTSHASPQIVEPDDETESDTRGYESNTHQRTVEDEEEEYVDVRRPETYEDDEQLAYENHPQAEDDGNHSNHGYHDNGYEDVVVHHHQEEDNDDNYGHQYNEDSGADDDGNQEQIHHQYDDSGDDPTYNN